MCLMPHPSRTLATAQPRVPAHSHLPWHRGVGGGGSSHAFAKPDAIPKCPGPLKHAANWQYTPQQSQNCVRFPLSRGLILSAAAG